MGTKVWLQCQDCGELHKEEIQYNVEDIYIKTYCPKCRDGTKHLVCSEDEDEIYKLYNPSVDPRYYNYRTK